MIVTQVKEDWSLLWLCICGVQIQGGGRGESSNFSPLLETGGRRIMSGYEIDFKMPPLPGGGGVNEQLPHV